MKIVILGGSGFIGTRLTDILLENGHQAIIGDLVKSEKYPDLWRKCDVCSDDDLRDILPGNECIVNLAASHRDDVHPISLYTRNNVEGAEHVCKIATEAGIRKIVFTSSVAIYGFPQYAYDEDAPKQPFNEYGKSKIRAEKVYEKWQHEDESNSLHVIRPTVVFGEGNRGNIYNLLHQLATRRFIMIGKGKNFKSMAYVGNIAAFLKWNIDTNEAPYSVYNYIDKPDMNMHDLIQLFEDKMQKKCCPAFSIPYWIGILGGYFFDILAFISRRRMAISSIRIKKFCAQTVFSADKVKNTGFTPPFTLAEGLERTIRYEFMDNNASGNR